MTTHTSENITLEQFQQDICSGIPNTLPDYQPLDWNLNHAPKRKEILSKEEKKLALKNALRYFPQHLHQDLAQ